MNLGKEPNDNTRCLGAIVDLAAGTSVTPGQNGIPDWVVGVAFIVSDHGALLPLSTECMIQKNVYSVFRADPFSIGFAELSPNADNSGTTTDSGGSYSDSANSSSANSSPGPSPAPAPAVPQPPNGSSVQTKGNTVTTNANPAPTLSTQSDNNTPS